MNFSKLIFSILVLGLCNLTVNAQSTTNFDSPFFLNGKINLGIGLGSVEVPGNSTASYGSGFGFEVGLGYYLNNNLSVLANIGYAIQLQYNATTSSYSGNNVNSSFFGRTLFRGGAQYEVITNQSAKVKGFRIGGGLLYEIPGEYSVTENNTDYGSTSFESSLGFYIDFGVPIHFTKKFKLIPYLRYNSNSTTVASGPSNNIGDAVNADFIEIGASIDLHL
ncbi:outer membrane beta-barrel protein [Flammeovirga aprica]|uniref:Porin family protein n=1 Tax=Flammeovirga aprica JL-4 TaxID=694437 RepID=A0A7X9P245_9BACT|nr:outer membrane beta-barrel protein [Flammeovirga aprica]NME68151.1 porin family protein [Flammeovirga aprica JL-4]